MTPRSLFPDWVHALPLQQQAVLASAVRGPDGHVKYTRFKKILWAYRASVMRAANTGDMLNIGERCSSFMDLSILGTIDWFSMVDAFCDEEADSHNIHHYVHFLHAAEILAYKHPNTVMMGAWYYCYSQMTERLHLGTETEEQLDARLGDFGREWDT